jgi:integrase/recombinase XerD
VELYARGLEARGLAAATVALKLVVLTGFYRYCVEQQLLEHSPAVHVRRPKVSQESTRLGLDRTELGAFLVQAGLSGGNDHALACLLALNALRVSEACGAELSDLALANGHRVVRVVGKGNQPALIPLAPRTMRAIDSAVGERTNGPLLARSDGSRLDRHTAGRIVRRLARRAGIDKAISPHSLRHAAITAAHSTATPPTSSPPTSPEPPAHADKCSRHGCRVPSPRGSRDCRASRRGPQAVQSDSV